MSKEKGMGLISIFLVIIIIIGLGVLAYFFIKNMSRAGKVFRNHPKDVKRTFPAGSYGIRLDR